MGNEIDTLLIDDTLYRTEIPEESRNKRFSVFHDPREVRAIIPGTIIDVTVRKSQRISKGEVLLILEAMKMYNKVEAEIEGRVKEIKVSPGDKVEKNQLMILID
ncbi:MAG: acetyl-CoA carboxylase biotin carboxyl carrier protein subunit [Deltaproteobacteria bacterium]|nr:acetyl-CoA carboxylase biotin carboxyl carrier protein subunit [Deltaproteobacteria bacterium]